MKGSSCLIPSAANQSGTAITPGFTASRMNRSKKSPLRMFSGCVPQGQLRGSTLGNIRWTWPSVSLCAGPEATGQGAGRLLLASCRPFLTPVDTGSCQRFKKICTWLDVPIALCCLLPSRKPSRSDLLIPVDYRDDLYQYLLTTRELHTPHWVEKSTSGCFSVVTFSYNYMFIMQV